MIGKHTFHEHHHSMKIRTSFVDVVLSCHSIRRTVHIKWLSFPQISATPSSLTTRHVLRHPLHFQDPNSSHSKSLGAWDLLWKLNCFQPLSAVSYRHDQDPIRDLTVFLLWRLWIGGSFARTRSRMTSTAMPAARARDMARDGHSASCVMIFTVIW